jgi:6-phosphogluconolactonase
VPEVFVYRDGPELAAAAAARLITALADAIGARGSASVVLTGGGIGTATLAAVAAAPAVQTLDWGKVDIWWGDERFLPAGDPERNETGARKALLDHIPVAPERVRPMPGPDGPDGDDPAAAAARYASWLGTPAFDVLMLGIGPEGHVASLFPAKPVLHSTETVVPVLDSPKPPPVRLSMTFGTIQAAREVWILASGLEKAAAVAGAVSGVVPDQIPASGAQGTERTLFLLDRDAAAEITS